MKGQIDQAARGVHQSLIAGRDNPQSHVIPFQGEGHTMGGSTTTTTTTTTSNVEDMRAARLAKFDNKVEGVEKKTDTVDVVEVVRGSVDEQKVLLSQFEQKKNDEKLAADIDAKQDEKYTTTQISKRQDVEQDREYARKLQEDENRGLVVQSDPDPDLDLAIALSLQDAGDATPAILGDSHQ